MRIRQQTPLSGAILSGRPPSFSPRGSNSVVSVLSPAVNLMVVKPLGLGGQSLGRLLAEAWPGDGWTADFFCAVPLHARRQAERGYNQSALLANQVASLIGQPYVEGAVARVRHTETQTHLDAQARRENVAGAFAADPLRVDNLSIVLVDDVLTTGATLAACAEALRASGARRVYGLVLASAVYKAADAGGHASPAEE